MPRSGTAGRVQRSSLEAVAAGVIAAFDAERPGARLTGQDLARRTGLSRKSPMFIEALAELRTVGTTDGRRLTYVIHYDEVDGTGVYALTTCPRLLIHAARGNMSNSRTRIGHLASATRGASREIARHMKNAVREIDAAILLAEAGPAGSHQPCPDCPRRARRTAS